MYNRLFLATIKTEQTKQQLALYMHKHLLLYTCSAAKITIAMAEKVKPIFGRHNQLSVKHIIDVDMLLHVIVILSI